MLLEVLVKMTTGGQLERWVAMNAPNADEFAGIFVPSTLRSYRPPTTRAVSLICNACEAGCHWIAMRVAPGQTPQFFSSYGLEPDGCDEALHTVTHFREWLEQYGGRGGRMGIDHNAFDFQAYGSNTCGQYCALFVSEGMPPGPHRAAPGSAWEQLYALKTAAERDALVAKLVDIPGFTLKTGER